MVTRQPKENIFMEKDYILKTVMMTVNSFEESLKIKDSLNLLSNYRMLLPLLVDEFVNNNELVNKGSSSKFYNEDNLVEMNRLLTNHKKFFSELMEKELRKYNIDLINADYKQSSESMRFIKELDILIKNELNGIFN